MLKQPRKKNCGGKRSYQSYSRENIQKALEAVTLKICSREKLAKLSVFPQGTISDYVKRNQGIDDWKPVHKPVFSP